MTVLDLRVLLADYEDSLEVFVHDGSASQLPLACMWGEQGRLVLCPDDEDGDDRDGYEDRSGN